jgi:hypothetical protein
MSPVESAVTATLIHADDLGVSFVLEQTFVAPWPRSNWLFGLDTAMRIRSMAPAERAQVLRIARRQRIRMKAEGESKDKE